MSGIGQIGGSIIGGINVGGVSGGGGTGQLLSDPTEKFKELNPGIKVYDFQTP